MTCQHSCPKLCQLLGKHLTGGLLEIWNGESSMSPVTAQQYRDRWIQRSGRDPAEFAEFMPKTLQAMTHPNSKNAKPKPANLKGPGWHLRTLISRLGFRPVAGCKCRQRAELMDRNGTAWCRKNIGTIIGWLKEEHVRSKAAGLTRMPWNHLAARAVVELAIRKAERGAK